VIVAQRILKTDKQLRGSPQRAPRQV